MTAPTTAIEPVRRRRWLRVLALQACLWPLLALGVELGMRAWRASAGEPFSAEAARRAFATLQADNHAMVPVLELQPDPNLRGNLPSAPVLHPYLGFDLRGGLSQLDRELSPGRERELEGTYVIAILGGSVAAMFGRFGSPHLGELLQDEPRFAGRRVAFRLLARGGFKQPQQALQLAYLLALDVRIDAVISIDGFNEVAIGNQNAVLGAHPAFPSVPLWGGIASGGLCDPRNLALIAEVRSQQTAIDAWTSRALELGLDHSAALSSLALSIVERECRARDANMAALSQVIVQPGSEDALRGPLCELGGQDPVAASVRVWAESSRTLRDLCTGAGITYLHVLQPTLHDPGAKPMTPYEEKRSGICPEWLAGVTRGYPLLREAGARLAAEGECFFDASRMFERVTEPIYFDACHLNENGNRMLAKAILPQFARALERN